MSIAVVNGEHANLNIGVSCLICGETVEYTEEEALALVHAGNYTTKVCDDCKRAIKWAKEEMKARANT